MGEYGEECVDNKEKEVSRRRSKVREGAVKRKKKALTPLLVLILLDVTW